MAVPWGMIIQAVGKQLSHSAKLAEYEPTESEQTNFSYADKSEGIDSADKSEPVEQDKAVISAREHAFEENKETEDTNKE